MNNEDYRMRVKFLSLSMTAVMALGAFAGWENELGNPTLGNPTYTYFWSGGANDLKMYSPNNWTNSAGATPELWKLTNRWDTARVFLPDALPGGVVNVDYFSTSAAGSILISGSRPVTFEGPETLHAQYQCFYSEGPVTVNTPAHFSNAFYVKSLSSMTFNYPVTANSSFYIRPQSGATITFNGDLTAGILNSETTVSFIIYSCTNSVVNLNGRVSSPNFTAINFTGSTQDKASTSKINLNAPVDCQTMKIRYNNIICGADNVLSPTGLVYFTGTGWGDINHCSSLDLNGHDQTAAGIKADYDSSTYTYSLADYWQNLARNIKSTGGPATFTLRPTADCETSCRVIDQVSLVLDAPDSSTVQSFAIRSNLTSGAIWVKKGVFKLVKGASFTHVKTIVIEKDGTLLIDRDNGVAQPFPNLERMELHGTLTKPDGVTLPVERFGDTAQWFRINQGQTIFVTGSGNWNTDADWTAGVPSVQNSANIFGFSGGTTVSVSETVPAATNLTIMADLHPVAFNVSSKLMLDHGFMDVSGDVKVTVKNGGAIENTGTLFEGGSSGTSASRMMLEGGAELIIENGGKVVVSNAYGRVNIGKNASSTATLTIEEGGEFAYFPANTNTPFKVNAGSDLDIRGKLTVMRRFKTSRGNNLKIDGGRVRISGNGRIQLENETSPDISSRGGLSYIYSSDCELSDDAVIAGPASTDWDGQLYFKGYTAGENKFVFKDNAAISNDCGHLYFYGITGGRTHYDMSQTTRGFCSFNANDVSPSVGLSFIIGGNGVTQFDFGGQGFKVGIYWFSLGTSSSADAVFSTNIVNLMNSAQVVHDGSTAISRSNIAANNVPLTGHHALEIGVHLGCSKKKDAVRDIKSYMTLHDAGCSFTESAGHVLIGCGRGEGHYIQRNGTTRFAPDIFTMNGNKDASGNTIVLSTTNTVAIVGAWGGLGELAVSNGTFFSRQRIFVGGCSTNDYFDAYNIHQQQGGGYHLNFHDAEGYLRIVGGTFTNKNAVILGSDGIGTLEIGPRAKVAIDELVMSNKTASVMTVKLDATSGERANTIEIGRLVITDGATISVDARGYDGKSANLFTFGELVGELPDIELISSTKIFRLNRLGNAVRLCRCDGTVLLFK